MHCRCGHAAHDHGPGGRCRVPDCPCEQFQPGDTTGRADVSARAGKDAGAAAPQLGRPQRAVLVVMATLALTCGPVVSGIGDAAEPSALPPSFTDVAAAARAASVVIRAQVIDAVAPNTASVPVEWGAEPDFQDDGWEATDSVAGRRARTVATGVIIDPRGIALTSARAVLSAPAFEVVLSDGTALTATVAGLDLRTDIAVLRLGTGGLFDHLPLGDSDRLRRGDWVIAVGAPLGLEGTVSAGIVTATPTPASANPRARYIESDAAVARGNAGGPLVNVAGEIIGLVVVLDGDDGAYAVPSKLVRRVAFELLEKGRVSRPWLGTTTQSLNAPLARALRAAEGAGVVVADVLPSGPGAAAGLRPGDIIVALGVTPVASRLQLERALGALAPGDRVNVTLRRQGRPLTLSVELGEEPGPSSWPPTVARRRLGMDVQPINPSAGAVVRELDARSAAARAGIKAGDVIREVNGQPVRGIADLHALAAKLPARAPALMRVQRGDVVLYIVVNAGE